MQQPSSGSVVNSPEIPSATQHEEQKHQQQHSPPASPPFTVSSPQQQQQQEQQSGTPSSPSSPIATSSRSIGLVGLIGLAFAFCTGGCFGIEPLVASGSAKWALLSSCLVTPIIYVAPQVLIVSELAGCFPNNQGHVLWVEQAWGRTASYFNSMSAIIVNSVDISLYPVLASRYVEAAAAPWFQEHAFPKLLIVRFLFIVVGLAVALRSAGTVANSAVLLSAIVIIPFVVYYFVAAETYGISPQQQWNFGDGTATNFSQFLSSSLWCWTGWKELGNLAGDVKLHPKLDLMRSRRQRKFAPSAFSVDHLPQQQQQQQHPSAAAGEESHQENEPKKAARLFKSKATSTMCVGLTAALLLSVFAYFIGLVAALTVPTERFLNKTKVGGNGSAAFGQTISPLWEEGFLSVAMGEIVSGGSAITSVVGVVAMLSLFVSSLAAFSRLIWSCSISGFIPFQFLAEANEDKVPVMATIAQVVIILPLQVLPFQYLQRVEFLLASVTYTLAFTSFLRLRYLHPPGTIARPYLVPGGKPAAWILTLSIVLVFAVVLIFNIADDPTLLLGFFLINGAVALLYFLRRKAILAGNPEESAPAETERQQQHRRQFSVLDLPQMKEAAAAAAAEAATGESSSPVQPQPQPQQQAASVVSAEIEMKQPKRD